MKVIAPQTLSNVVTRYFWDRSDTWEAWSIIRWWVFFGALTVLIRLWQLARLRCATAPPALGRRLLLFAPWIALIDVAFLPGVWVDDFNVIPERSTVFANAWHWDSWLRTLWLARGAAPTLLIGTIFFRAVAGWKWRGSIAGGLLLIPLVINLSLLWSILFLRLILPCL